MQDAKAKFSELVRRARDEGPQHVTLHGEEAVVVVSAQEYRRLNAGQSGQSLIDAFRNSPHREIELAPERHAMPVRSVDL